MLDQDKNKAPPITVAEIKTIAKTKLRQPVWDYYTTGADEEQTLIRNETIYTK